MWRYFQKADEFRKALTVASAFAIATSVTGCTTTGEHVRFYDGAPLKTNEIVLLKIERGISNCRAFVWNVDGKPLGNPHGFNRNNTIEIEMLPGTNTLQFSYQDDSLSHSITNMTLTFYGQAGQIYELHVAPINDGFGKHLERDFFGGRFFWTAWIIDTQNGEVVAGRKREEFFHWYE